MTALRVALELQQLLIDAGETSSMSFTLDKKKDNNHLDILTIVMNDSWPKVFITDYNALGFTSIRVKMTERSSNTFSDTCIPAAVDCIIGWSS